MRRKHALIIVRQAGTANAFESTVDELRANGWELTLAALDAAQKLWGPKKAHHVTTEEAVALVNRRDAAFVLTGSSFDAAGDGAIWAAAHGAGIPCLAYLDGWSNYAARFSAEGPFDRLPDHIAVIDPVASRELAREGCPMPANVVGNLVFDALLDCLPGTTGRNVLIATEPIAEHRGFREIDVVDALLDALPAEQDVVIKPHPRENREKYIALVDGHPRACVADEAADRIELMNASRAVIGMTSMLLVEAAFVGLPVLSVQPTGRMYESLISEERGIGIVTDLSELKPALASLLEHHELDGHDSIQLSAPEFAALIAELAGQN